MKKLALVAAIAALSACADKAEEAPAATDTAMAEAAAPAAADELRPGAYQVKYANGTTGEVTVNADGTFSVKRADGEAMTGTVVMKDGKACFDPEGDAPERCWTDSPPDASGMFTSTADDGEVVTVTPPADAAAPAAAAS